MADPSNDVTPSALQWPAMQEFDNHVSAIEWAFYQVKAGGPRYYVHQIRPGVWEAIQTWLRAM